jgi:hypothetical protein
LISEVPSGFVLAESVWTVDQFSRLNDMLVCYGDQPANPFGLYIHCIRELLPPMLWVGSIGDLGG